MTIQEKEIEGLKETHRKEVESLTSKILALEIKTNRKRVKFIGTYILPYICHLTLTEDRTPPQPSHTGLYLDYPDEIIARVMQFCISSNDVVALGVSCKRCTAVLANNELWRQRFVAVYGYRRYLRRLERDNSTSLPSPSFRSLSSPPSSCPSSSSSS